MQRKVRHDTVFLAIDGDTEMKTSKFHQSHRLIPHPVSQ